MIILIGNQQIPFQIAPICFYNLSPQFAFFMLNTLPRRNGYIIYRDMDEHTFQTLGDFQYRRDYDVPLISDPFAALYEPRRRIPTDSIINWVKYKWHTFNLDPVMNSYFEWFMDRLGPGLLEHQSPLVVDAFCLIQHVNLYLVAAKHSISELTAQFADAFLDVLIYVYECTDRDDPLRICFWQILALIMDRQFWPELYVNPKLRYAALMYEEVGFELSRL